MDFLNFDFNKAALSEILVTDRYDRDLFAAADLQRRKSYGNRVFIRGLIEFSSYCKNDCYYCGIRCSAKKVSRYRLTKEEILTSCRHGYSLGFRTFVLQGGEDPYFTDELLFNTISAIHSEFPDCAITLSLGERSRESYRLLKEAGACRYLLRHETSDDEHYKKLHPPTMLSNKRKKCLFSLKELGYCVGSGFMVQSPYQTTENIISDIEFLRLLQPDMIGIGPFIPHSDTPFAQFKGGTLELTLRLIAVLRLIFPYALIPSTTALGTIHPEGRELGLRAGANVVMPNLSPKSVKGKYEIYENKLTTGAEDADDMELLKCKVKAAGYEIVTDIGNVLPH